MLLEGFRLVYHNFSTFYNILGLLTVPEIFGNVGPKLRKQISNINKYIFKIVLIHLSSNTDAINQGTLVSYWKLLCLYLDVLFGVICMVVNNVHFFFFKCKSTLQNSFSKINGH